MTDDATRRQPWAPPARVHTSDNAQWLRHVELFLFGSLAVFVFAHGRVALVIVDARDWERVERRPCTDGRSRSRVRRRAS